MTAYENSFVSVSRVGEFGLIDLIKKDLGCTPRGIKGIGDDTAVVPVSSGKALLLTTDMLVEGVHFTKKIPPQAIGHKAIACSISDIAAMGGLPRYALVSLGIPAGTTTGVIRDIYKGIKKTADCYNVNVVGGDTVKSSELIINVALTGEVKKKELVLRSKARVGDYIFVSGPLGNSLKSGWHARFTPRLKDSQYLVKNFKPSAMIDCSDGLAADLGHILAESRVGACIDEESIPRRSGATLRSALYEGEDFELIFTLSARQTKRMIEKSKKKFNFIRIGRIIGSKSFIMANAKGKKVAIQGKGFTHF